MSDAPSTNSEHPAPIPLAPGEHPPFEGAYKVAGPVGEALIMTAFGLFVAIPAVLAYNTIARSNRVELTELDAFAHDLHAWFSTGTRISPLDTQVGTHSSTERATAPRTSNVAHGAA